jgi:hypothetical protein
MDHSLCLQAPYSLHKSKILSFLNVLFLMFSLGIIEYNHFEIVLSDKFNDSEPPPGIFYNKIFYIFLW